MPGLFTFGLVAYPVLVYVALGVVSPRTIALGTLGLFALRAVLTKPGRLWTYAGVFSPVGVAVAATAVWGAWSGDPRPLLLEPAASNLALLGAFGASLFREQSAIERLARAQVGELPPYEVTYCRKVTGVWCAFFAANAAACAGFALYGSRESWAVYTGAVSYVLIGA
ncbi:MAG TPA: hypothetical protein VMR50_17170, partial [Myxococcota bacterium]|nr:hypothetical protein [Myxococcota bacterium]